MIQKPKPYILLCALLTAFSIGCHKPEYDEMQPSKPKWALGVVAHAESLEQQKLLQTLTDELTREQAMTTRISWTPAEKASQELETMTKSKGLDLLVFEHQVPQIAELARKNQQMRFTLLGNQPAPDSLNVRRITHDRDQLLFFAGFLAGEANRDSKTPFSVLVDHPHPADDKDWQLLVAGARLAGQSLPPLQVVQSDLLQKTTYASPFSGKALVLLDPVGEAVWPKIGQFSISLVRTDENVGSIPLQGRVLAQPGSLLVEAVKEEADLLTDGKWQGKTTVALTSKHTYRLLLPGLFPDKNLPTRLELFEDQYVSGLLKPSSYKVTNQNGQTGATQP
ncbi:MAG TPA: hypothetical protein VFV52_04905 [Bacilli bacterium]|nr:hypothetical protein [Bacilli bacterium]